jgi:hypothetical protein
MSHAHDGVCCHFLDRHVVHRSVFGAELVRGRAPVILALANTRIVLNVGVVPPLIRRTIAALSCG